MKHSTPESMKFKRLMRRLRESKRGVAGLLELLWISTANNARRGDIGQFSNEEIAIECDWEGNPDELVEALVDVGFLDASTEHRLIVHDWHIHAPGFIKAWVKSQNTAFCLPTDPTTSTPSVPPSDQPSDRTSDPPSDRPSEGGIPNPTKPNQTQPNHTQADPARDPWPDVVVVLLELGILKAKNAVELAKRLHTVEQAQEIIRHWSAIPGAQPGTLFNWLTVAGSFDRSMQAEQAANQPRPKRAKDPNVEWERHRSQCVKRGREQGMTEEEIETRLEEMRPRFMEAMQL